MKTDTIKYHLFELKSRLLQTLCFFSMAFAISYAMKEKLISFLIDPLVKISNNNTHIIYTGLTEAFFSYVNLSISSALFFTFPYICYQVYKFIKPALLDSEKKIFSILMLLSPILFYLATIFVYYIIMPNAWGFFLSYESHNLDLTLSLEPKISEYIKLVMQLALAFALAFQLPIIIVLLNIVELVTIKSLQEKRRIAIVCMFVAAAILTPPDVLSQIMLAFPLVLLYEASILLCKLYQNQKFYS